MHITNIHMHTIAEAIEASKIMKAEGKPSGCTICDLLAESRNQAAYFKRIIANGYTQHRFHRVPDWESQYGPTTPEHAVLMRMKANNVYSLIIVDDAVTSAVGPTSGVAHPNAITETQQGPALFVTGGFFVHKAQFYKPRGEMHYGDKYLDWTVGETSLTANRVTLDASYGDVMKKRVMSDGSFVTSGPSLNEELDLTRPHFTQASTPAMRYIYDAYDVNGQLISNPMTADMQHFDEVYQEVMERRAKGERGGPSLDVEVDYLKASGRRPRRDKSGKITFAAQAPWHHLIRTAWASVPANLSHASQPNERCGIIRHSNGIITSHASTSLRKQNLDLNEFRCLMMAGAEYLGLSFQDIDEDEVWANDGGGSIFQIFKDRNGNSELLTCGGQEVQDYRMDIRTTSMRDVPHAILIRNLASE